MGQELKNPLRGQSKYGLMGSSAKTGKIFFEGHRSTFWIKMPFGIGHPPTYTSIAVYSVGGAQGSQIFKRNSIISIHSKVMAFLVILLSPCGPCRPRIVPVIPTSSPRHPCHPHCPYVFPIAPRRSPCGLHGLWSPHVVPVVPIIPTSSPSSPHHPHVIPIVPTSSPHCPHRPHVVPIAPRRSPCGLHGLQSPHVFPIIPVIPTSSPSSPYHPHIVPIIPVILMLSP